MRFHVLTLFPDMVREGLNTSIIGRAITQGNIELEAVDIRAYSKNKHKKVDDYIYGGGAGMLMQADPVFDAYKEVSKNCTKENTRVIYVTPQGTPFDQQMAKTLAAKEDLIFLCGHYEGIDDRVLEEIVTDYVSIGDYVLTGGELPAMVMIDAISRLVPKVLHNEDSTEYESFSGDLLEYPQYSRPETWHDKKVPSVLLSGNHKEIEKWRREQAIIRTRKRRPDLYEKYNELMQCREILWKNKLLHIDMINLIDSGQAVLMEKTGNSILLKDKVSHAYMISKGALEDAITLLPFITEDSNACVVPHQKELCEVLEAQYGARLFHECVHAVYTLKESLPMSKKYDIHPLTLEDVEEAAKMYTTMSDEGYLRSRIRSNAMWGIHMGGELAGFIGIHEEGSMGMLEVKESYRHGGMATALESFLINELLYRGRIPYCQVFTGNEASIALQKKLGLYFAKTPIWWYERW